MPMRYIKHEFLMANVFLSDVSFAKASEIAHSLLKILGQFILVSCSIIGILPPLVSIHS